ncbi:hypothetical protein A2V61_02895 [Candidatus Woesebacteria bacterium RBG_19FT_COMBO_47_8]|nr:MAG: hypothetical protein A2V61_02895 [Candidatus Woesebacteria bacterium RBG_19FT_COMBO_47_8]
MVGISYHLDEKAIFKQEKLIPLELEEAAQKIRNRKTQSVSPQKTCSDIRAHAVLTLFILATP